MKNIAITQAPKPRHLDGGVLANKSAASFLASHVTQAESATTPAMRLQREATKIELAITATRDVALQDILKHELRDYKMSMQASLADAY